MISRFSVPAWLEAAEPLWLDATDKNAWLEVRRNHISGTDEAGIHGVSPWSSPFLVWLDKLGKAEPIQENAYMSLGKAVEDIGCRIYAEKANAELVAGTFMKSKAHPVLGGTPDFLFLDRPKAVEHKAIHRRSREKWGAAGTDEVPDQYLLQALHYALILDVPEIDIVALVHDLGESEIQRFLTELGHSQQEDFVRRSLAVGTMALEVFPVRRDKVMDSMLIGKAESWWERHIVKGIEPDVDGSEETRRYLAQKARSPRGVKIQATGEIVAWAERALAAKAQKEAAEQVEAEAKAHLMSLLSEADGALGDGLAVSWVRSKDKETVDWRTIASLNIPAETLAEIVPLHTKRTPSSPYIAIKTKTA